MSRQRFIKITCINHDKEKSKKSPCTDKGRPFPYQISFPRAQDAALKDTAHCRNQHLSGLACLFMFISPSSSAVYLLFISAPRVALLLVFKARPVGQFSFLLIYTYLFPPSARIPIYPKSYAHGPGTDSSSVHSIIDPPRCPLKKKKKLPAAQCRKKASLSSEDARCSAARHIHCLAARDLRRRFLTKLTRRRALACIRASTMGPAG